MPETAIFFPNSSNERLLGVWHAPDAAPRAALVMLHGWSGTRTGPHQMLTRAARAFCEAGFGVLRFDFGGRGDSEGDATLATLATMAADTRAAFSWVETQTTAPLVLVGLCSGCEVAVAAYEPKIAALALWSAPVFAALPSQERAEKKRNANLGTYARKLLRPATYLKLLRGQLDTQSIGKAMAGGGGAASKNLESDAPGQLPPGFRKAALENWKKAKTPLFLAYGSADPTTEEALNWHRANYGGPHQLQLIEGANHSFYGLGWEREVIEATEKWLNAAFGS